MELDLAQRKYSEVVIRINLAVLDKLRKLALIRDMSLEDYLSAALVELVEKNQLG